MKKKRRRQKMMFRITLTFHNGRVGGKDVDTGVHANGKRNPSVVVNLRDPDSIPQKLPTACEGTRKALALLSDVIGLRDYVMVRPNELVITVGDGLDRGVVGRHALYAFREAYNLKKAEIVES